MRCGKVISCLNAYVDREVAEEQRLAVKKHLAACESCRGRIEEIRGIDELLQGTFSVPPVPNGLAARIMAEAQRRQPTRVPERPVPLPAWNPFRWITEFSAPMRLAACATALLAVVAGLSLDGGHVTRPDMRVEQRKDLYGFEWFASVPPGSIGSIYIAMADEAHGKGSGQ